MRIIINIVRRNCRNVILHRLITYIVASSGLQHYTESSYIDQHIVAGERNRQSLSLV